MRTLGIEILAIGLTVGAIQLFDYLRNDQPVDLPSAPYVRMEEQHPTLDDSKIVPITVHDNNGKAYDLQINGDFTGTLEYKMREDQ